MAQTPAWMAFNRRGSTELANRSTKTICTANMNAHPNSNKSLKLICVTPAQLKKYRPATARPTLMGTITVVFFLRKNPITGTITMYIAVKKPDFPASVPTSPTCCRLQARNRGMPQRRPAFHSCGSHHRERKVLPSFLKRSKIAITGSRPITARKQRTAWKVNGSI